MYKNDTTPYKRIYLGVLGCLATAMIAGSLSMQDNPHFQNSALIAKAKGTVYTLAYAASQTRSVAQTFGSISVQNTAEASGATSVPILVFHGILDKPDGSTINVTEKQFREYLFALKDAGYETITLEELHAFGTGGDELPAKPIMITFDDGRGDSFYRGDPILDAVDYTAVIFPITKYSDEASNGGYYLSRDELKMVQSTGRWEIGSHSSEGHTKYEVDTSGTLGNFFSNHLWIPEEDRAETRAEFEARINKDFKDSHAYLENLLDTPITSFAFPFGDFGQNQKDAREKIDVIESLAKSHYKLLFYQYSPGEYFTQMLPAKDESDSLLIRRIDLGNSVTSDELLAYLAHGNQKSLPFSDTFSSDAGWIQVWGDHAIQDGVLSMSAEDHQSGAATILDGTESWVDYTATMEVTSPNQTGILVWARFQNDDNNAACNFGTDFVHIEETVDGEKNVLKGVRMQDPIPEGSFTLTTSVQGRVVTCSINGNEIVRTEFLDESLTRGGIGIKIWDETLGKSSIIVDSLEVAPVK